jgi:hypothetical protein
VKVLSSKTAILLVILFSYVAIILPYAARFDYNFSGFACIGSRFSVLDLSPPQVIVLHGSRGYDGQFFYYAARDPFIRGEAWRCMDVPAYRYVRIIYPWLAALLALGDPGLIFYTLVLVNLAGILMGSYFVLRWLQDKGMNPWYAVFYGLLSGFFLCIFRDLAGPVAMGLLVGGLYFFSVRKLFWGGSLLGAALLTREVVLIVPVVFLLFALLRRQSGRRIWAIIFSFVPLLLWSGYVFSRFGMYPLREGGGNFGGPLSGVIIYVKTLLAIPGRVSEKVYLAVFLVVCLFSLLLAIREVVRSRDEISVSFLIFSLFPIFLTTSIWVEPWSYGRVLLPSAVLLIVNFIRTNDRLYLIPLSGNLILSGVVLWYAF